LVKRSGQPIAKISLCLFPSRDCDRRRHARRIPTETRRELVSTVGSLLSSPVLSLLYTN
jgi:hypothetical protein